MQTTATTGPMATRIADLRLRFQMDDALTMDRLVKLAPAYLIDRDMAGGVTKFCDWEQWSQFTQRQ